GATVLFLPRPGRPFGCHEPRAATHPGPRQLSRPALPYDAFAFRVKRMGTSPCRLKAETRLAALWLVASDSLGPAIECGASCDKRAGEDRQQRGVAPSSCKWRFDACWSSGRRYATRVADS